jgi:ABC-type branched-subunit amino acid transport system substrate-binding protein/predicted negative regulator of RcsB-dependent stress response
MSLKFKHFSCLYITAVLVTTLAGCATGSINVTATEPGAATTLPPVQTAMSSAPAEKPAMPAEPEPQPERRDVGREREELLKYQEAVRLFREETRADEAYELLESFLVMHPASSFADDAMLEQARIRLYQEEPGKAADHLKLLLRKFPASPLRKRSFLELQKIYFAREKWRNCIEAGRNVLSLDPLPDEQSEALNLKGSCLLERRAWNEALADLVAAYRSAITEQARQNVISTIEEKKDDLRDRHLDRALAGSDGEAPYGLLAMIRLERDIDRGLYESGMASLMDLLVHYPGQLPQERIDTAFTLLASRVDVNSDTVGVILPLTGPYGVFGQKALQGIQTAFGFMSPVAEKRETPRYNLVIRDSAADPRQAAQAVRDLVNEEQVVGIIGPLFSRTSRAAAEAALETGTPLVTLTADPGVPLLGKSIFSRTLTDDQQINKLVGTAFDRLGIRRFGILYPDSAYGNGMMHLFWDELDSAGAQVTAVESFPPGGPDFGPQIRALVGLDRPLTEEQKELKADGVEVELEPIVDFEALFIPADFQTVGLLAPQLAFYDVNQVLIMGADGWNSPWLPELGEHYVEGALFTAGFTQDLDDPDIRDMVQDYWLAFGENPGSISVQSYDVAMTIRMAIDSGQVVDRAGLTEYLANLNSIPSTEGPLTTDADGFIRQKPVLLTVHKGKIERFEFTVD